MQPVADPSRQRLVSIVQPAALDMASCSLDDFTIGECVGMGAFASVHKATRRQDNCAVVLKKWHAPIVRAASDLRPISHGDETDEEALLCFVHELAIFARTDLQHKTLVQGLGHGYCPSPRGGTGASGFLAMEAAAGADLRVELRRRRPHLPSVVRWMRDLAAALSHLHAQRVIHRDVKPSNCMVSQQALVLVDYGLAIQLLHSTGDGACDGGMACAPHGGAADAGGAAVTSHQAHLRVGVVPYMSPEQYGRHPYGLPVDVYAFGRIMQEVLLASEPDCVASAEVRLRELAWSVLPCASPSSYERVVCRPVVGCGWPSALALLVTECQHVSPAARPLAATIASRMEECVEADPSSHLLRRSTRDTHAHAGQGVDDEAAQVGDLRTPSRRTAASPRHF